MKAGDENELPGELSRWRIRAYENPLLSLNKADRNLKPYFLWGGGGTFGAGVG